MFIFALLEARFLAAYLAALPFLLQLILCPALLSPSSRLIITLVQLYTTTACVVVVALLYKLLLYPALFSPLSRLPQPHWSCSVSSVWILWLRYSGRENHTLHEVHHKYGPIVRIGPAEVSINSVEAVETVYQGGFDKHSWYSVFKNYGIPNTSSATRGQHHSVHKRLVPNVYSKTYISSSPAAASQADVILNSRLMPLLCKSAGHEQQPYGIDVHSLFCAVATDFITAYCFGISRSSNFIQDKNYRDHWLKLYTTRKGHGFFERELPFFESAMRRIGLSLTPAWARAVDQELQSWCKRKSDASIEYLRRLDGSAWTIPSNDPVVVRAILAGISQEAQIHGQESPIHSTVILQPELAVASEVFDHIMAGQGTTGISLTYLSWHLSQSLDLQRQLRQELRSAFPSPASTQLQGDRHETKVRGSDAKELDALPILHAVIMETVRRYAPAGGPEPRIVPGSSVVVAGHKIPGGTRISASAYNLHRDERAYPDPLRWDHTRWLKARTSENPKANDQHELAKRHFWGFSSGGRMCLGSNFAMHEMKVVVAAIWANYVTHVVDDDGIDQSDAYTGHPKSNSLYLRFERV